MPVERDDLQPASPGGEGGPAPVERAAAAKVTVSGNEYTNSVSRIILEQFVDSHHHASVRLNLLESNSPSMETISGFVGAELSISLADKVLQSGQIAPVNFVGVVTGVNFERDSESQWGAVIVAHSPTVKMDFAHKNKVFEKQRASEIISALLGQGGLSGGAIDNSTVKFEHVVQYRETDWEFARRMASSYSVFLFYDGQKVNAANAKSQATRDINKEDFGAFKLKLGATGDQVEVHGWDYKAKQGILGIANGKQASGMDGRESTTLSKSNQIPLKGPDYVEYGNLENKAHADVVAKSVAFHHIQTLGKAAGQSCAFNVNVGRNIKLSGMGVVDGSYFVTYVRHELTDSGSYRNWFEATPTNSAYPLLFGKSNKETAVHPALVTDNIDKDNLGRVKVKFPWLMADESFWARVIHVDAGKDKGLLTTPDVDDEVLVSYEFGDPSRPIVIGNLYNGKDEPIKTTNQAVKDGKSILRVFKTRAGNEIVMDDTSGKETVSISQKDGKNSLTLTLDGPKISIVTEGDFSIKAKAIKIETTGGDIAFDSKGKFTVKSQADTELKATAGMKLQGMTLEAKGDTTAKVEAGATLDVKGGAMVNVKGAMVNLN